MKVPILVFSHIDSEVSRSAAKYAWGKVISENNEIKLKNAILDLIRNKELRESLSKKSFEHAMNNFDSVKVRNDFRKIFLSHI